MKHSKAWMMILLMAVAMAVPATIRAENLVADDKGEDPLTTLEVTRAELQINVQKLAVLKDGQRSKWEAYYSEAYFSQREAVRLLNKSIQDENTVDAETRDADFIKQCRDQIAVIGKKWGGEVIKTINRLRAERAEQVAAAQAIDSAIYNMRQVESTLTNVGSDVAGVIALYKNVAERSEELVDSLTKGVAEIEVIRDEFVKSLEDVKKLDGEHFGR